MANTDFVHLHVHTEYSLLDGLCKVDPLLAAVQKHGQHAIALTDHGAMYGAVHFYNACKKVDLKPIIGCELYMARNSRFDKQIRMGSDQTHLTVLAMNLTGYQNLMKLVSTANFEGFSYKPRVDLELLSQHQEGLVVLSGCMGSIFNRLLSDGKKEEAIEWFSKFKDIFGDRFYVELQHHPRVLEQNALRTQQLEIARLLNLPIVATNDVHYVNHDDAEAQDALVCVQTRKLIDDNNRMKMIDNPDLFLKSGQEMEALFHETPEAIKNTLAIAEMCNVSIETGTLHFPNYPVPTNESSEDFLKLKAEEGLTKRYTNITQEITDRLNYELEVINTKGYANYFLITQDFVNWAKEQEIGVGPGRGSAAGSLVSYSLGITDIDPLLHNLPFERFLNPQRPTPPDIDLDFADDRRDEVINYVSNKYGSDHVAHVITFGKMEARVAIRDIGRVLGLPYEDPDKIAKLIPNVPGQKTSLDKAIATVPELAEYYKQPKFRKLIDLARKVESGIRHSSVHAAAIIIADKPLTEYTPIQKDTKSGKTVTQYDMYVLDLNITDNAIGLLKFDFLGLRNLTVIQRAVQLIKATKNEIVKVNELPLDDTKTYELLSSGETIGIFQLESAGMRRVAKSLRPNQFSDITAMVALYRPGPMDLIPKFIEGKHKPNSVVYPHPSLKPILEETYGIMVYQEQVMQIANVMAGFSLGEADILRRAIGKKKKKLLDENKRAFIDNSVKRGYEKAVVEQVWNFIEAFANYGFNKAHAASYAMIAYQTAYLKANYQVEYMAALMSTEASSTSINKEEKITHAVEVCKKSNITVLPPNINHSRDDFMLEQDENSTEGLAIRFGFNAIKNVGSAAIDNILETRDRLGGNFSSFTEFLIETDSRKVNKKVLESLIKVGVFTEFATRASLLENLEDIRQRATQFHSEVEGQDTLFAEVNTQSAQITDSFLSIDEYPQQELLSFEKELLGLYLTDHPLGRALKNVSGRATKQVIDLDATLHEGQIFLFGGYITQFREVVTKKGKKMGFGRFADQTGNLEIVVFPKVYQEHQQHLKPDTVVLLKGKVDFKDDELKLLVEKITIPEESLLEQIPADQVHEVFIPRKTDQSTLQELGKLLKAHPGEERVVVLIPNGETPKKIILPYGVAWNDILKKQVDQILA